MSNRSIASMEDDADVFLIVAREAVAAGEGLVLDGEPVVPWEVMARRLRERGRNDLARVIEESAPRGTLIEGLSEEEFARWAPIFPEIARN